MTKNKHEQFQQFAATRHTPGRIVSRRRRFEVLERYGYRCVYCGRGPADGVVLQVDHAMPFARGGGNEDENLVASCVDCQYGKRDRIVALPAHPANTFLGWLRVQKGRDDIVGDLSRDEERDRLVEPVSFKHLAQQILRSIQGSGAVLSPNTWVPDGSPICAAWHAWREYRRGGKPTILVEKLRVENAKREQEALVKGTVAVWKLGELINS